VLLDRRFRDWLTVGFERTVLAVVRTTTTLTRLLDVLSLLGSDRRVQVVFTRDPDNAALFGAGVDPFLERLEAPVISWRDATRTSFDLAVAASENDRLATLDAPVLLVPHGVGHQKYYPNSTTISGMNPERLVDGDRVVPAAIAVAHPDQQTRLRAECPAAAERAVVVGDPSLARMAGSAHRQRWYRERLSGPGRALVVLASTWGPHSLLGGRPGLVDELVARLPVDEYRLAVVLHPGIWAAHGPWQVRSWLAPAVEAGVHLVCPYEGWQAALVGASVVLADHGSLALYAAALDKPLLMAVPGSPTTVQGSALAVLGARAPVLDPARDLREQVVAAVAGHAPGGHEPVTRLAVLPPAQCAGRLRELLYELLRLPEPAHEARFPAVGVPGGDPPPAAPPTVVVGAAVSSGEVAVERFPDLRWGPTRDGLDHRHLVADVDRASLGQLAAAAILVTAPDAAGAGTDAAATSWRRAADELLRQWPDASLVAAPQCGGCRIRTRTGESLLRLAGDAAGIDPVVLGSLAYARLSTTGRLSDRDRLRIGSRVIEVIVEGG
jgi:hypothetical protein